MKISLQKRPAFRVAGINANGIESAECPDIWKRLFSAYSEEALSTLGSGRSFGVCHDMEDPERINYLAGYEVQDAGNAEAMGLTVLDVPEAEYAVVEVEGRVPDCIHQGWKYVMEVYFPESGYTHSGQPDFEAYLPGDMDREDYRMELWIPVVKE